MACNELNYSNGALTGRAPKEPKTDAERESQWRDRRARAYQKRDDAERTIKLYAKDINDPLLHKTLAEAHEDLGKWTAETIRLGYEGFQNGWIDTALAEDIKSAYIHGVSISPGETITIPTTPVKIVSV